MTRKLSTLFFALATLFPVLASAVPGTVGFSARIADNGRPLTGSHEFVFAFWDCDGTDPLTCVDPGNVIWTETQTLDVQDGVVSAVLGADDVTPNLFPAGLFNGSARWLAVAMDGTAFGPFMAVHSVPYAIRAATAEVGDMGLQRVAGAQQTIDGAYANCSNYANATCYYGNASASCPTGKRVVGGGCFIGGTIPQANIMGSYPAGVTGWGCYANSASPTSSLTAYALCARMQ